MKPTRKQSATGAPAAPQAREPARRGGARQDLQPPPTGGNAGSPAAPVMKQFAKTKAESSGRS